MFFAPKLSHVFWVWFALVLAVCAFRGDVGKLLACIVSPMILEVDLGGGSASNATAATSNSAVLPASSGNTAVNQNSNQTIRSVVRTQ